MLNHPETSENVYLAFNQHIGLTNKKFENLVHLTFNDKLFKRHGRWRSEKAKNGYVKDNLEALLSVSKSLEI